MRGRGRSQFMMLYSGTPLKRTPLGPPLCVCNSGASGILPLGRIMCTQAVGHNEATFLDLSVAVGC